MPVCKELQAKNNASRWLNEDVPEQLRIHAESCTACSAALKDIDRMRRGFETIRLETQSTAKDVDVVSDVMAALDSPPMPISSRPWNWKFTLVIPAFAALAMIVLLKRTRSETFSVNAPNGVSIIASKVEVFDKKTKFVFDLPATLKTDDRQHVSFVSDSTRNNEIWPNSEIGISADALLNIQQGGATLSSEQLQRWQSNELVVSGAGLLTIERRRKGNQDMKTLKKHGAKLGAVVAAVAVYGGYATIKHGGTSTRVGANEGVAFAKDGTTKRFGLTSDDPSVVIGKTDGVLAALDGNKQNDGVVATSGAFWDEDHQVVQFKVDGEVLDSSTGEAISDFQITASPLKSMDYGQLKPKDWNFENKADGKFQLGGLGFGQWRITGQAPGFAPVHQTLDLEQVDADPYLVIPLSIGYQLSGQVVDSKGQPVSGATVGLPHCFGKEKVSDKHCKVVESSADGRFELPGMPEESVFALRAEHAKHGMATIRNLSQSSKSSEHVVIQLEGVVRIHGVVYRGKKQQPAVGVTVVSDNKRTRTNTDGSYELKVTLTGRPEVFIDNDPSKPRVRSKIASYPKSRSAWELSWVDAPTHVAEIQMDFHLEMEHARLYGQVTDSKGVGIPNLEMHLANTTGWKKKRNHETFPTFALTDDNGRYSIDHIPAEAGYQIGYMIQGSQESHDLGYVNIRNEEPVEANFTIGEGAIRGRFVSQSGDSVSSDVCRRFAATKGGVDSDVYFTPHCYDDGRFEFIDLPTGKYVLKNPSDWMNSPSKVVETSVEVGQNAIVNDVVVEIIGEGETRWSLRILNSEGRFLTGAYLSLFQGQTKMTMNLEPDERGIVQVEINDRFDSVSIDRAGHESSEVMLKGRNSAETIEVRLSKL